ncbi:carboxylesterase family protein [Myxococcota bacterium]|nr:carboxylesterase family protein [Myxococcota bacterium]
MNASLLALLLACGKDDRSPTDSAADDSAADDSATDTGPTGAPCPDGLSDPAISTTTGCVTGLVDEVQERFLGVPYAAPPVGALRFLPPAPITPWDTPLSATEVGPICVQHVDSSLTENKKGEGDEDCLTLNILRPAEATGPLPILFFTHGGGYATGSGSQTTYLNDPNLPDQAIVITHNYRLGPLGFLAHPALSAAQAEGVSGNMGLLDTIMALRWVFENAEALGGDPSQLLIFGESAGGLTTCALLMAPEAQGLFSAAIVQSAPCLGVSEPLRGGDADQGEGWGESFAEALGCDVNDPVACLQAAPLEDILTHGQATVLIGEGKRYAPVLDGVRLPLDGALSLRDSLSVPVTLGANHDEGTVFVLGLGVTTETIYAATVRSLLRGSGADADKILAAYPSADYGGSPEAAFAALYGDAVFVCPTLFMAEALAPTHTIRGYHFLAAPAAVGSLGAFHGLELSYVFGTGFVDASPKDATLAEDMQDAWTALASGEAAVGDAGPWSPLGEGWARWDRTSSDLGPHPKAALCEVWAEEGFNPW